jgi:hypothetical protein
VVGTFKGKASRLPRVTSVSADGFSTDGKTFLVDEFAKITVDGAPGELRGIRVGMRVLVSSRILAKGATKADTIYRATRVTARTVGGAPAAKSANRSGSIAGSYEDELDLYGNLIAGVQEWTNSDGNKITAGIRSVTPGKVLFVLESGKTVDYPLFKLSQESQDKILKLAGR